MNSYQNQETQRIRYFHSFFYSKWLIKIVSSSSSIWFTLFIHSFERTSTPRSENRKKELIHRNSLCCKYSLSILLYTRFCMLYCIRLRIWVNLSKIGQRFFRFFKPFSNALCRSTTARDAAEVLFRNCSFKFLL